MQRHNIFYVLSFFIGLVAITGMSCSSSETLIDDDSDTGLQLISSGDFASSASASVSTTFLASLTTGQCADLTDPITQDEPQLEDGLDCDEDDGLVTHITPTQYTIAFKRVSLISEDENLDPIDFIADTETLADSAIIDFTESDSLSTIATLAPEDLVAGTYSGIEAEVYYFQMTFPVGETTRNVRIYMSDDDFAVEGNLGHHQGDITFIDDDGSELGWIDGSWSDSLATSRGTDQNGAGGVDAETSHDRGFFGDTTFWNQTELVQGDSQDVYVMTVDFESALVIPDPTTIADLTAITATFSIADTFFYEDFAPQGTGFFPDTGGEASAEGAAWAPLAPTASLSVATN